jgi:hypothetical protein
LFPFTQFSNKGYKFSGAAPPLILATSRHCHIENKRINTAGTKMTGAISGGQNGFGNARRNMFPTWNDTARIQVLIACATPLLSPSLSLSLFRSVTLQRQNGDSGAESVLCAAFAKHESVSVQRTFRRPFVPTELGIVVPL